ncbi:MAG TPA: tRNA (guanosine(37)-N1)-methyltransferase TrmD [Candidatus Cybelea sp.]|nr:tRNA (guanosine(37)-N1)-methyltransferase TrmD [Candidatus Cybelea sp.]
MSDRCFDVPFFEQQASEIGKRRRVVGVRLQRSGEIFPREVPQLQSDSRHPALVEKKGPLSTRRRLLEQRAELQLRLRKVVPVERLERASKFSSVPEHFRAMFEIDVITLFPEVFAPFVGLSIVGRAVEAGVASVRYHHLLDYLAAGDRADDAPFGGGPGMVLRIEPIAAVLDRLLAQAPANEQRLIVVPAPGGKPFDQSDAQRLAALDRVVFVCGHYEGIDDRLGELFPVVEYSLGDFVLTGGELPALAFMDATIRLLAGAIRPQSLENESFAAGMLDYPCFTRPATFRGIDVPEVLLSGDHAKIARWRREQSRLRTAQRRRDLLDNPLLDNALHPKESP